MNEAELRLQGEIEDEHWWFLGKRLLLRVLLEPGRPAGRLVDLGCGTGGLLRDQAVSGSRVGVDRSALALGICAERGLDRLVRADLRSPPFRAESFDTLLAFDVIEHLDDDVEFLRRAKDLCAPGGRFVIAVPAFQFMWSQHDVVLEHRRRYTARSLVRAVRKAGLVPVRVTYTNFFVFPVAAAWRVFAQRLLPGKAAPRENFVKVPRLLNALLVQAYRLEAWLLKRVDLPFGVSVVCVAELPERTTETK